MRKKRKSDLGATTDSMADAGVSARKRGRVEDCCGYAEGEGPSGQRYEGPNEGSIGCQVCERWKSGTGESVPRADADSNVDEGVESDSIHRTT